MEAMVRAEMYGDRREKLGLDRDDSEDGTTATSTMAPDFEDDDEEEEEEE
jgi:hypothetical protein